MLCNTDNINAGTLALPVARSSAKLENTSLSADGSRAPAYDIVCIAQQALAKVEYNINVSILALPIVHNRA